MSRSLTVSGIVLKSSRFGEADRLVTLFTLESGKLVALAKSVRLPRSTKKAALEPGCVGRYQIITTKSLPLLVQATLESSHPQNHTTLPQITKFFQILEITDALTVEAEPNPAVYRQVTHLLVTLPQLSKADISEAVRQILVALGFTHDKPFNDQKLKAYVEQLIERPLKTKLFLTP